MAIQSDSWRASAWYCPYCSTQARPAISALAADRASTSQFQRQVVLPSTTSLSSYRTAQTPGTDVRPEARHADPFGRSRIEVAALLHGAQRIRDGEVGGLIAVGRDLHEVVEGQFADLRIDVERLIGGEAAVRVVAGGLCCGRAREREPGTEHDRDADGQGAASPQRRHSGGSDVPHQSPT